MSSKFVRKGESCLRCRQPSDVRLDDRRFEPGRVPAPPSARAQTPEPGRVRASGWGAGLRQGCGPADGVRACGRGAGLRMGCGPADGVRACGGSADPRMGCGPVEGVRAGGLGAGLRASMVSRVISPSPVSGGGTGAGCSGITCVHTPWPVPAGRSFRGRGKSHAKPCSRAGPHLTRRPALPPQARTPSAGPHSRRRPAPPPPARTPSAGPHPIRRPAPHPQVRTPAAGPHPTRWPPQAPAFAPAPRGELGPGPFEAAIVKKDIGRLTAPEAGFRPFRTNFELILCYRSVVRRKTADCPFPAPLKPLEDCRRRVAPDT